MSNINHLKVIYNFYRNNTYEGVKYELNAKIKNQEYKRLVEETKIRLINNESSNQINDFIKHPILIKNIHNYEIITEIKAQHIGQIQKYMNYIDKNLKNINHDKTIGIIICKKDNVFIMEYCSDEKIYRTTY